MVHNGELQRRLLYIPDTEGLREELLYEFYGLSSARTSWKTQDGRGVSASGLLTWTSTRCGGLRGYVDTSHQVKPSSQRPAGLLSTPTAIWERVPMDLTTGLPTTKKHHDAIFSD